MAVGAVPFRAKRRAVAKAVFLDKDGTLVDNVPYNVDPGRIELTEHAATGLRMLACAGYRLFVVSNQSGVARGLFAEEALAAVQAKVTDLVAASGVTLSGFYYCPHHPDGTVARHAIDCSCRKPKPGLLFRAASEHRIDLCASWFIGDILDDVQAGKAAGCRTVLLDNGNETEWRLGPHRTPDEFAPDLASAARAVAYAGSLARCS